MKDNLNGFSFGTRNCVISEPQWLKSVASKNKSSKINFANHEAIVPHTEKNSNLFISESSSPEDP
jgi:hypothetical protein